MILYDSIYLNIREVFCNAVKKVFGDSTRFIDFLEDGKFSSEYDIYLDGSGENYIINRETGEYINWYKLYHIGRCTNISVIQVHKSIPSWFEEFLTKFRDSAEFADRCRECEKIRKGHRIWNFDKGYCKCSECGIGMGHKEFDYCPNCGAKMVEPQESEDCRDCKKFDDCPCGKDGHESGTSQGYSIGECKDFETQESEG